MDTLLHQFERYQLKNFQEKLFVHLDKDFFLAGETVFFKVYDLDGYTHKPIHFSSIVSIELVNADQKPAIQLRIPIDSGTGAGSFIIPPGIHSGMYTFRAYSSWMKNFSPDFYFHQIITVVNTINNSEIYPKQENNQTSLVLFPEGGNLVYGLKSKVAFKSTDQYGSPAMVEGAVINQSKDTILKFRSSKFGMGNFGFTPQKGNVYEVVYYSDKSLIRKTIGPIFNQGYVMALTEDENNKLRITISTNDNLSDHIVYLFSHCRGVVRKAQYGLTNHGEVNFNIDENALGEGITHFTVFSEKRQPVCERLYFKQPVSKMNLQVATGADSFRTRSRVDLAIKVDGRLNSLQSEKFSISVIRIDSFSTIPEINICNYLLLSSDLKGRIDSIGYYFGSPSLERKQTTDNLMMTQGWLRFKWEDILESDNKSFEFLPEIQGTLLTAVIRDRISGKLLSDAPVYLTLPGKQFELVNDLSDKRGRVRYHVKDVYGQREMIAVTDSNGVIEINNTFSDKYAGFGAGRLPLLNNWKNQLTDQSINAQTESLYHAELQKQDYLSELPDTLSFYGPPDKHYNLDDYTRFQTLEEVMREYISEVRVRSKSDKFIFRVFDRPNNIFFDLDPLVLYDGMPVKNLNKLLSTDPLKIKSIDIITNKYFLNGTAFYGIISYKTYLGDLEGYEIDPGNIVFKYEGLHAGAEFYSPDYSKIKSNSARIPDFRDVLYWTPEIQNDGRTVSFFTSDLTGKYVIIMQGISLKGETGFVTANFTVIP